MVIWWDYNILITDIYIYILVGGDWNMWIMTFSWEEESELYNSIIFQRGRSTTNQKMFFKKKS